MARISEVFGYGVDNWSDEASESRANKHCPFKKSPCTKDRKKDPLGICSFSKDKYAAVVCPARFLEKDRIFIDVARLAFGDDVTVAIFPEVKILRIEDSETGNERKIGKVDFLLGHVRDGKVVDFAAIEVQAVYISGSETRTPLKYFLDNKKLDIKNSDRRPDFRSSTQKRLMPQLRIKVPVFRRWGKKFFVVVDNQFFGAMPPFSTTTKSNSEITWLVYPFAKVGKNYSMKNPKIIFSDWDEVKNSLREGIPPEQIELVRELQIKLDGSKKTRPRLLKN